MLPRGCSYLVICNVKSKIWRAGAGGMMSMNVRLCVWVTMYAAVGAAAVEKHSRHRSATQTHATHATLTYEHWRKVRLIYVCKGEDTRP